MLGRARVPGACGELVQGMIDGKFFLITCPINITAEVRVTLKPGVLQGPRGKSKALRAVQLTLAYLGSRSGARVSINNPLPSGKGLASSTADVVAAITATAAALGVELSLSEIKNLALAIEPTDGTFFPGIVFFDHRRGQYCQYLGQPPPLQILVVDPGGTVDTVRFNLRQDLQSLNQAKESTVRKAVELVKKGLKLGEAELLAEGATLSALANQEILFKPELEKIREIALSCGALGVNAAHSGTVMGIFYQAEEVDVRQLESKIKDVFPYVKFRRAALSSGGVEVVQKTWSLAR